MTATILKMASELADALEPFRAALLWGGLAAEVAVGIGIIIESWKPKSLKEFVAFVLIVSGVVLSAICTLLLFSTDEGISNAQQSKIISLETRIAPRQLSGQEMDEAVRVLFPYSSTPWDLSETPDAETPFVNQIIDLLKQTGWQHLAWAARSVVVPSFEVPSLEIKDDDPNQAHAVVIGGLSGVEVLYPPDSPLKVAAKALASVLTRNGIVASAHTIPTADTTLRYDEIHVRIGSRL